MKSTEGKVRGRPPIRKQKNLNSSASSGNENNTSILDFFSPPRKTDTSLNNNDKRSGSTPRRRKNPLENLQSNLSPKYIGFSTPTSSAKRRSKYRTAKLNDCDGPSSYFQSSHGLIGCVRRTTVHGRLNSPKSSPEVSSRRNDLFESPIEKLLRRNGAMKSLPNSPTRFTGQQSTAGEIENCIEKLEEIASRKKNCVVRLEQMNHSIGMVGTSSSLNNEEVEPEFDASSTEHNLLVGDEEDDAIQIITIIDDEVVAVAEENPKIATISSMEVDSEPVLQEISGVVDNERNVLNDEDIKMKDSLGHNEEYEIEEASAVTTPIPEEKTEAEELVITTAVEIDQVIYIEEEESQSSMKDQEALKNDDTTIVEKEALSNEEQTEELLATSINNQIIASTNDLEKPFGTDEDIQIINIPYEASENNNNKISGITTEQQDISDSHIHNEQLLHVNSKFSSEDMLSLKSPSTYSVDSAKGSSLDNDLNWVSIETGDLFWGQIFTFTYWPCMVCPDPEGKTISFNENGGQSQQNVMIHVRFFADNGRRSWVKRDNLMSYNGLEAYKKKQKEVEQKLGKKHPKYRVFVVSKNKLWNQAIREADLIETIGVEERLDMFFKLLDEVKINNNLERKRRQSTVRSSTSDLCSMFDSTDNLYLKQTTLKRDRSPTPVSPAFSPVAAKNSEKRIKLDDHNISRSSFMDDLDMNPDANPNETLIGTELERMKNEDIYNDIEFKKFASAMRSFIMENTKDPTLNYEFMVNVRSMWALKHITVRNRLEAQRKSDGMKRLSQRIRNITIQRSLPSTPVQNHEQQVAIDSERKPKRRLNRPIDEVIDDIFQLDSKYLFRDMSKEPLCKECCKGGPELFMCSMNCQTYVHPKCSANCPDEEEPTPFVHITADTENELLAKSEYPFICKECFNGEATKCFVCKKDDPELGDMARCSSYQCSKLYHEACLKYWPQAKLTKSSGKLESLRCPAHVCHTCVSDDPKGKYLHIEKSKLTKCTKCPATYHMDSTCIPAGSEFLSAASIICPRHFKQPQDLLLNVNWCFICVAGGKLICCETCPTAVHAECLKIPVADEGYICEECETGRMPLYGEMVWAKFKNFRWWPSLILPPTEVPLNLANKAHNPSEFVIRFLGSNDHAWITRRRVYLYQEGDCCEPPRLQKIGLDLSYMKGVAEARRIAEIIKEKKMLVKTNDRKQRVSPLPYVKIKVNRAVPPLKLNVYYEKISKCECDKDSENPCAQDSGCLNRVLYNECNPKICPAGERCQNQEFEKRLYPKLQVMYMNEKGFGLICLEPISAGTFVIEYVGEVIDDAEFRRRISQKEQERDENFYFLSLEKDYIIDAGPKGNLARFMNHSCDPNCETQKWSVNGLDRIGLFAIKDIPKNTELTFNYFWDELLGNEKKNCHCGAATCAGVIGGKNKKPGKASLQTKPSLQAKPSPPLQEENISQLKISNRRLTNTKLKPQKTRQRRKPKEANKPTKLPAKVSTSNTSSIADTTVEEDKPLEPYASTSSTSLTLGIKALTRQSEEPYSESVEQFPTGGTASVPATS